MLSWREHYLDRLTRSTGTEQLIFAELAGIVGEIGFEYCSVGIRLPRVGSSPRQSWMSTYPAHWLNHYFSHDYAAIDPAIDTALHSPAPVVWSDELFKDQPCFWEEARAHGVRHGWILAMHGRCGETGLISVARSAGPLSSAELAETEAKLVWLSHVANGVIGNLVAQHDAPVILREPTEREREVLRWTAMGKTSDEIGIILGISTRTVNFHIATILAKLDAVNKTQAVAKAMMFDLFY